MAFTAPEPAARGGSLGSRRRTQRRPFTEINIVPLTDVVLVLLVIFMVTAQFIQQSASGLNLNLPSASQVEDLDQLHGIRVEVDRDGRLAVDGMLVAADALPDALRAVMQDPQQLVIVEGDRDTVLQNVVTIMDAAMAVGLPNVVLATAADAATTAADPAVTGPDPAAATAPTAAPIAPAPATAPAAPVAADPVSPFPTPPPPVVAGG